MRIAVTGASGFVGRSLISELLNRGHTVRALVRYPDAALAHLPLEVIATGPIEAITDWRSYLNGIDAVVHLAARAHLDDQAMMDAQHIRAVNTDATLALAKSAAKRKVQHFVYLSSASVHGDMTEPNRPLRVDSPYNPKNIYARSKADAERGLRTLQAESGMGITTLRPPLVYGPGARGNFRSFCQLVAKMSALPFGMIDNRRSLLAAENLASAISAVLNMRNTSFQPYLVSDGTDFSLPQLVKLYAAAMDKRCVLLPVPRFALIGAGALIGKKTETEKLTRSFQLDASAFRDDFGWQAPTSAVDALKKSVHAFALENNKANPQRVLRHRHGK